MAHPARSHKLTRRDWLLAGLGISVSARVAWCRGPEVLLHMDGDALYISAPDLHFLTGSALDRLKDGLSVVYVAQLSLSLDGNRTAIRQQPQRFILSRDLWNGRFSVTSGNSSRRIGLSLEKAEAWCLESLAVSTSGIAHDQPVWLRLDVRVADPKDPAEVMGDSGVSLSKLIDIFSRRARAEQQHWTLDQGPFRLGEVKKAGLRSRSG